MVSTCQKDKHKHDRPNNEQLEQYGDLKTKEKTNWIFKKSTST